MKTFIVFLLFTVLLCSCEKSEIEGKFGDKTPEVYDNYLPLKVGNYWIYETFQIDEHGIYTYYNFPDSCYIGSDTVIRNKTFYKTYNFYYPIKYYTYLSDSLHYVIDNSGFINLSSLDFHSILAKGSNTVGEYNGTVDTMFKFEYKMTDENFEVSTPAGTFKTINTQCTSTIFPKYYTPGNINPKINAKRYAKNVGVVYESVSFVNNDIVVGRRLLRYHLN